MAEAQKTAEPKEVPETLRLWNGWAVTDKNFTKAIEGRGFKGTDINPTYRAMKMTEAFGAYGEGWGIEKIEFEMIPFGDGDIGLICHCSMWWKRSPDHDKCITGPHTGGDFLIRKGRYDDEAYKKCQTDAMTQSFRFLGISADVYMGLWDNSKYQAAIADGAPDEYFGKSLAPKKEATKAPPTADAALAAKTAFDAAQKGAQERMLAAGYTERQAKEMIDEALTKAKADGKGMKGVTEVINALQPVKP